MDVHYLFKESCLQYAHHTAVEAGPVSVTYAELSEKAGRLAEIIRAQAPDAEFIGISTDRSLEMVVRVLAVLQAGKAYVPLDPAYPEKRLRQIISSAKLGWCLAPMGEQALFEGLGLRMLPASDAALASPLPVVQPEDHAPVGRLAYVLFTSGSTGEPKGVCMGHAALVNLLQWQQANSAAGAGTRTLQFAPLSFDVRPAHRLTCEVVASCPAKGVSDWRFCSERARVWPPATRGVRPCTCLLSDGNTDYQHSM